MRTPERAASRLSRLLSVSRVVSLSRGFQWGDAFLIRSGAGICALAVMMLPIILLESCGSQTTHPPVTATPTPTPPIMVSQLKGDGGTNPALGSDITTCDHVDGFAQASDTTTGASFADVALPPASRGYSADLAGNLYAYQLVTVCSEAIDTDGVLTFFIQRMSAAAWSTSATYPYGGDATHACGDPYCWRKPGATAGDSVRYVSLEHMRSNGSVTVYALRLATSPKPVAHLVIHSATGSARSGGTAVVNASCADGEQMVSGGYYISTSGYGYRATSSYPSSPATWTVSATATGPVPLSLETYVGCLQANYTLATQIVSTTVTVGTGGSQSASAACPTGAVVTGGGLQLSSSAGVPAASAPDEDLGGWQAVAVAGANDVQATVYALCATRNLAASQAESQPFTIYSDNDAQVSKGCGADQWLTSGGYSNNDPTGDGKNVYVLDGPQADYSLWFLQGHNLDTHAAHGAYLWAVCVTPAPRF